MDKQKKSFNHKGGSIERENAECVLLQEDSGLKDGAGDVKSTGSPARPKDGSVRETLKWMSGKNPYIENLIDEFKLEII